MTLCKQKYTTKRREKLFSAFAEGNFSFSETKFRDKYSRWMSCDPAVAEYMDGKDANSTSGGIYSLANFNLYHYSNNNPVKYVDPTGLEPYDKFATLDEAAEDFSQLYNDDSISKNREFGTSLYQDSDGNFYYPTPNIGSADGAYPYNDPSSENDILAGFAHTHGAYDEAYLNNEFSDADKDISDTYDVPIYVGTPNGSFQKYENEETNTLNNNLPSDPNDPDRQNKNNYSDGSANEFQYYNDGEQ